MGVCLFYKGDYREIQNRNSTYDLKMESLLSIGTRGVVQCSPATGRSGLDID